jgi:hypothetical protein
VKKRKQGPPTPETLWLRSVAGAFRGAVREAVNRRVYKIVIGWLEKKSGGRLTDAQVADRLGIDPGNANRWKNQGDLSLPTLIQVLLRAGKDFKDLLWEAGTPAAGGGLLGFGPADLQVIGTKAALEQGYSERHGVKAPELRSTEVLCLKVLYAECPSDPAVWQWVFDRAGSRKAAAAQVQSLLEGRTPEKRLQSLCTLIERWGEVAWKVFDALEDYAETAPGQEKGPSS